MKSNCYKCKTVLSNALLLLPLLVLFSFSQSFAAIGITVNGQANGASFAQGVAFQWNITGLSNGANVSNQLWIDLNTNGIIEPATDLLFASFSQTDGVGGGNNGPGDEDGLANGAIATSIAGLSFPVGSYIFKTTSGVDAATSAYSITAMVSPTFFVSGKVTKTGIGMPNVTVRLAGPSGEYYALTDANGDYSIATDMPSGSAVSVSVPKDFNSGLSSYIVSPNQANFILTANVGNVNFILLNGKIVTGYVRDTLGNAIADMSVYIYRSNGGNNGYDARTDINGKYSLAVDTGTYKVRFGYDQEHKGYLITYYNQKNVSWLSDDIHILPSTDTLKNINAILRNGALIMGTFKNNGISVRGGISAFAYNVPGSPLYEVWHDSTDNFYYLYVPPGTYTIQFNRENGGSQVYYNQTYSWPGNAVTLNLLSDTAKNINVEFSTIHTKYVFIGNGNWDASYNWKNNLMPPSTLMANDTIVLNHSPGGECILNVSMHILPGGFMTVAPGKNLLIKGELKLLQ